MMRAESRRRFTIVDGMVLVAALGVGFAATRLHSVPYLDHFNLPAPWYRRYTTWILRWLVTAGPCMGMLSTAVVVLSLRPPRPALRRRLRHPGIVAAYMATFGLLFSAWPRAAVLTAYAIGTTANHRWETAVLIGALANGSAIASGWLVLWLARRFRPEPRALDRLGRALGVYWITTAALANVSLAIEML
jgi:hypothetical protein